MRELGSEGGISPGLEQGGRIRTPVRAKLVPGSGNRRAPTHEVLSPRFAEAAQGAGTPAAGSVDRRRAKGAPVLTEVSGLGVKARREAVIGQKSPLVRLVPPLRARAAERVARV